MALLTSTCLGGPPGGSTSRPACSDKCSGSSIATAFELFLRGVLHYREPFFTCVAKPILYLHEIVKNGITLQAADAILWNNDRDAQSFSPLRVGRRLAEHTNDALGCEIRGSHLADNSADSCRVEHAGA